MKRSAEDLRQLGHHTNTISIVIDLEISLRSYDIQNTTNTLSKFRIKIIQVVENVFSTILQLEK